MKNKRMFLAVILGVLLMSFTAYAVPAPQIYETGINPDDVINIVYFTSRSNDISMFYIVKDLDGYRLYGEASSFDGQHHERYTGYATEIGSVGIYELVFYFTNDHDSVTTNYIDTANYIDTDVLVVWRSSGNPEIIVPDEYDEENYLFEGEYSSSSVVSIIKAWNY